MNRARSLLVTALALTALLVSSPGLVVTTSQAQDRQPAPARVPEPPAGGPEARTFERATAPPPSRNVKVDVTISDQTGSAPPVKKLVSMIVADGRSSGVRSETKVPISRNPYRDLPLNIDATVHVTPDQRVLLDLRFNYGSVSTPAAVAPRGATSATSASPPVAPVVDTQAEADALRPTFGNITENLSVLLTPGVSLIAARSADAASDRTVTVEVTAAILK